VRPAAILRVYQVSQAVRLPIIGMGGIWDADDAIEFLVAGASAVEVGTSLFYDPRRPWAIVDGLGQFLEKERIGSVSALVGTVQLNTPPPSPETVEAPAPAGEERVADSPS
jgi:dihydroorotate dehydrogenase (NAD+) catalytic subunit